MNNQKHIENISKLVDQFNDVEKPISDRLYKMIQSFYESESFDRHKYEKIITNLHKEFNDNNMENSEYFAVMVEGKQTPSKLYENNYNSAEKEATRLCTQTKNTAYVLKVVSKIELNEVKITRFE